jgi:hypothetical protein
VFWRVSLDEGLAVAGELEVEQIKAHRRVMGRKRQ